MGKNTYKRVVDLLNEHIPAKISRNEFCRVTGINRNSIDRYRVGLGTPIHETLEKIAVYFGVSVEWLRGETDVKHIDQERTPEKVVLLLKNAITEKGKNIVSIETGIGIDTIDSYLNGIGKPTTKIYRRLSKYFGLSDFELMFDGSTSSMLKKIIDEEKHVLYQQYPEEDRNKIDSIISIVLHKVVKRINDLNDEKKV